ncbi:TPA: hypothetical protein NII17_000333 [Pseudomonas aeruginosa]|uniref:competence protein CoiA family protein n=1 Tax=Pseudomonas aeruginosa TaxID=287 RepID=UPI003981A9DB|nr:hypothetical protein [Pseudomonas aeruginosa]HBP1309417.1 hypothetical protein [Pseudomonas aeruginosa]HCF6352939.1 hypothetical protein [Pseudomonas aeruginosa]
MGLLAYRPDGAPVVATYMSDEEWFSESQNSDRQIFMPVTGCQAVLKISPLGLRFFAHKPGDAPGGGVARESDDHLALKVLTLLAARDAGWNALPEVSGTSPSGGCFRADVLCTSPSGKGKVAVEIQRSSQRDVDYEARQQVYKESGIRGIWIDVSKKSYRKHITNPSKVLPRFECRRHDPDVPGHYFVRVERKEIDFSEFICGALQGRLQFCEYRFNSVLREFPIFHSWCRRCEKPLYLLEPDDLADLVCDVPNIVPGLNKVLGQLASNCKIRPIYLKRKGGSEYLSVCRNCGIGQFYLNSSPDFEFPMASGSSIAVTCPASSSYSRHWCWDWKGRPDLVPDPGLVFFLPDGEVGDREKLQKIRLSLGGIEW